MRPNDLGRLRHLSAQSCTACTDEWANSTPPAPLQDIPCEATTDDEAALDESSPETRPKERLPSTHAFHTVTNLAPLPRRVRERCDLFRASVEGSLFATTRDFPLVSVVPCVEQNDAARMEGRFVPVRNGYAMYRSTDPSTFRD
jgi:hypothetical protein